MLIRYPALTNQLTKPLHALYLLTGQDDYLLNDVALRIKQRTHQQGEVDRKTIHLLTASDWSALIEEANSYSLFSEWVLIDAYLDKKSLDKQAKETLLAYLGDINPRCTIIIRAPNLAIKTLQWLVNHEHVLAVQVFPFSAVERQRWVIQKLNAQSIAYDADVPERIHQYTQGNMLACAQVLDKLALTHTPGERLTTAMILDYLSDQCDYQLYELADACLSADSDKAIHILRRSAQDKTEPTLVLWQLSQEIRQLIQLATLLSQSLPMSIACQQLKIWPQRVRLYEMAVKRFSTRSLHALLIDCQKGDEQLKSSQYQSIWRSLEQIAIRLCCKLN